MKYTREQIESVQIEMMRLARLHPTSQEADAMGDANDMLRQLIEENDALREDTARLDFVEANPQKNLRKIKRNWSFMGFTNYEYEVFSTVREAIDAARKESKE